MIQSCIYNVGKTEYLISKRGDGEERGEARYGSCQILADGLFQQKYDDVPGIRHWQQLMVPLALKEEIMQELHVGPLLGPLSVDMTVAIKEKFYWP